MVILGILLLPGAVPVAGLPSHAPAHSPAGTHFSAAAVRPGSALPPPGLPGADSAGQRTLSTPPIALSDSDRAAPVSPASPVPRYPAGALTQAPRVVAALGGTVTGRVYDATFGQPIVGATITVEPFSAVACVAGQCVSNTSGSGGLFSVPAPVGPVSVIFSAPFYVGNRTWTTVTDGGAASLGFVFLLHDGFVTGVVRAATPGHAPIAGVALNATSRNGLVTTGPGAVTAANGSFTLAVPPSPSSINLVPGVSPSPYFENTTYSNVTPYQTESIGTVYLEGGVSVEATLVDRATGLPIAVGTPSQLTVCTRRANFCQVPILNVTGPLVQGFGMPGAAYVEAYAIGYVVNTTPIPDLPNTNGTVNLGAIDLVPMAALEISTNLTGGTAPGAGWPTGNVTAYVCSLDSLNVALRLDANTPLRGSPCWPRGIGNATLSNTFAIGSTAIVLGPPLRDAVFLVPANGTNGSFPIAETVGFSPSPEYPTSFANLTWVNLTPDQVTIGGSVDVSPGTYVHGSVAFTGYNGSLDGRFSVQVCSTEAAAVCGPTLLSSDLEPAVLGCPSGPADFCVPAPPGPDHLTLTELGPNTTNSTWFDVPRICCAQSGHPLDVGPISIALSTLYGLVVGTAIGQEGGFGSPVAPPGGLLGTVEACPVVPPSPGLSATPCTFGLINATTGQFSFSAPSGWDQITVQAFGYVSNWTWVDVNGTNSSGTIELVPVGYLSGYVLSADGGGVAGAEISVCPVGSPFSCTSLATAGTDGEYNGSLSAGQLPWGTYEVTAQYSGYVSDWTWVNTTANVVTKVPTLVLPVLAVPTPTPPPGAPSNITWVTGRIVDLRTGLGIPAADLSTCDPGGCFGLLGQATDGGTFNVSLETGFDQLLLTAGNYLPLQLPVPESFGPVDDLGVIGLQPYAWLAGQLVIANWSSLASTAGLGAPLEARACIYPTGAECGSTSITDTAGEFNISASTGSAIPSGVVAVYVDGPGVQGYGSAQGGFPFHSFVETVAGNYSALPAAAPLSAPIYGGYSGRVIDGSGQPANATTGPPAEFVDVTASNDSSPYGQTSLVTGPGGDFTVFLEDNRSTSPTFTARGAAYRPINFSDPGPQPGPNLTLLAGVPLAHYGWVTATVVSNATGSPLDGASVSVAVPDPANITSLATAVFANGNGFANLSLPSGASLAVTISAPGYFSRVVTTSIIAGMSVPLGSVGLTEGAPPTGFLLQSHSVNTVGTPAYLTALDPYTRAPLAGASITAQTANGTTTSPYLKANGIGEFLLYVPATPYVYLTMTQSGYDPLTAYYASAGVSRLIIDHFNTTGAGVVSGRVIVEPTRAPLYDVPINGCPVGQPACISAWEGLAFTNLSGEFWVTITRGFDQVTVSTEDYLTNTTPTLGVATDLFYDVGTIPVYAFAQIFGTVRGVPSGALIAGADVEVCSVLGVPYGPCDSNVTTDANGSFRIGEPPSSYVLVVNAPGYNQTYETVYLGAGEQLDVGTILLLADAVVTGHVTSLIGHGPIPNATVLSCDSDAPTDCSPFLRADSNGSFVLLAPPGLDALSVSAPGFVDNFSTIYAPSGGIVALGPVYMTPLTIDIPESVAGTVVANATGAPIAGAPVTLDVGPAVAAAGITGADGTFSLPISWGTYDLTVSFPGYFGQRIPLVVHSNVTGVQIRLSVAEYGVSGTVRDATTGVLLAGATLSTGGAVVATSSDVGTYRFELPNGTYSLVAAENSTATAYAPLPFTVVIAGRGAVWNVSLTERTAEILGLVVDADSGLPIPLARVAIAGPGISGAPVVAATAAGAFSIPVGTSGEYTLNVSAPGYQSATIVVQTPVTTGPVTVALSPNVAGGGAGGIPLSELLGALAVAVVIVALIVVLERRRPPPPPGPPRWTLEEVDEPLADPTTGPGR